MPVIEDDRKNLQDSQGHSNLGEAQEASESSSFLGQSDGSFVSTTVATVQDDTFGQLYLKTTPQLRSVYY